MRIIGFRTVGTFLRERVRWHVARRRLNSAYAGMAKDKEREAEAWEWAEISLRDVVNEAP